MRDNSARGSVIVVLAAIAVAALLVTLGPWTRGPGHGTKGKAFEVGQANVNLDVQPDAAIRVTENLRFDFSPDDFSGAYRDIALDRNTQLTGLSVSDAAHGRYASGADTELGSSDTPNSFGTTSIAGGERVVWHYDDQRGGSRIFSIKYRAIGSTEAYDDVVYVHWAVWGDQWEFALPQLEAALTMSHPASGDGRPLRVWATPGKLDTTPAIDGTGAAMSTKRVPAGTQVVLSAIYPRSAFTSVSGAVQHPGNGKALLMAQADAAAPSVIDQLFNWLWVNTVLVCIVLGLVILAVLGFLLWRAREHPQAAPQYVPGPPADLPPAVGYGLAFEGIYSDRVVLATLLDLADRGFYDQSSGEGAKKLKQLDLVLAKPAGDRPAKSTLTDGEAATLDFFDQLIGNEPGALSLLQQRIPKHDSTWRGRWEKMNAALAVDAISQLEWDLDLRVYRWVLIAATLVGFGLVGLASLARASEGYVAVVGFVICGAALLIPTGEQFERLDQASREKNTQWQAFARWTRDFPRLKDDPPATLLLWKKILVFGVAFGTAKRVIDSGRIPPEILASSEFYAGSGGAFIGGGDYGSSFGNAFSGQVAAQSSGGGAGGGGGSSGGGGGGAW